MIIVQKQVTVKLTSDVQNMVIYHLIAWAKQSSKEQYPIKYDFLKRSEQITITSHILLLISYLLFLHHNLKIFESDFVLTSRWYLDIMTKVQQELWKLD